MSGVRFIIIQSRGEAVGRAKNQIGHGSMSSLFKVGTCVGGVGSGVILGTIL